MNFTSSSHKARWIFTREELVGLILMRACMLHL